jgi:Spy/CpxP family protein refolding chaperone
MVTTEENPMHIRTLSILACGLLAAASFAQHAGHGSGAPPYAGLQQREIKALSPEESRALLEGQGMRLALAAELNGYPGPAHVLELAQPLQLTPQQRQATQALMDAHKAEARALGAEVVEAERALDRAFAQKSVTEAELARLTARSAELQARLRTAHLRTHLQQAALLTPHQVAHYQSLRGYDAAAPTHQGKH